MSKKEVQMILEKSRIHNDYAWLKDLSNITLFGYKGSNLYRLNSKDSDKDYVCIVFAPMNIHLGLDDFKDYRFIEGENKINLKDDSDIEFLSVKKFLNEAYYGEFVYIEPLFVRESKILRIKDLLQLQNLQSHFDNTDIIISKSTFEGLKKIKNDNENMKRVFSELEILIKDQDTLLDTGRITIEDEIENHKNYYGLYYNEIGEILINNKDLFISTKIIYKYLGYLKELIHNLNPKNPTRLDTIDRINTFGYDTKKAMSMQRIIFNCFDLLDKGILRSVVPKERKGVLLDIKNGLLSKEELIEYVNQETKEINRRLNTKEYVIKETPNRLLINELYLQLQKRHYNINI